MNKKMIMLMAAALALLSARGQVVDFTDWGEHKPIEITLSDNQTSLNKVFVVYNTDGVGMTYTASTDEPVVWKDFNDEPIENVIHVGRVTRLPQVIPNKGYKIVEGNTSTHYYWVVNYAEYPLEFISLDHYSDSPCSLVSFTVEGRGDAITYCEVDGTRHVLDRQIKLTYNSLGWNEGEWQDELVEESFPYLDQDMEVTPPLCDTGFTLSGDYFLEQWNIEKKHINSPYYLTQAVDCFSTVEMLDLSADSTSSGIPTGPLSAPVRVLFKGYDTDAVVYRAWELATDADFENIIDRNMQDELTYTFNDAGTYFMRYMVANGAGTCEAYGETYTIMVSESWLPEPKECPNVFSPNGDGVNDKWKIPHKSIAEFHCWIFNRWGNLVYEYTDPDDGWDGTYHGKLVDAGVYFYVVTATGTDGVTWKRRGDITIIRYKKGAAGTSNGAGSGTGTGL